MQLDRHYTDPSLVAVYDSENAGRDDIDFYLRLAARLGATRVTDLGCGTGVLAVDLADAGLEATGVDPAAAMLDFARHRPGGERVSWIEGDASALASASADLIVMTGHVAQVFLSDDEWNGAVAACARALVPGGHLAFETRNPDRAGWSEWTRELSFDTYRLPDGQTFQSWVQVTGVRDGRVEFEGHTVLAGVEFLHTSTLRFRTRMQVQESLIAAGLVVTDVYGDWDSAPASPTAPELIFIARRP